MPRLEAAAKVADEELAKELAAIPNVPLDEVPDGVDEHGNVVRHHFGRCAIMLLRRNLTTTSAERSALWISRSRRSLSGSRFVVLKKGLARLERAIGQFMLDVHTNEHGYTEVNPPLMVNRLQCLEQVSSQNSKRTNLYKFT